MQQVAISCFLEDPAQDLRLGAWFSVAGLVRVQPTTSSPSSPTTSPVTSSPKKETEYVASLSGKFLQTYFRRVVEQLYLMQMERKDHYFLVQYFAKVRLS